MFGKNDIFWTVVLEKIFESPLDSKKIKSLNPQGNQPWIYIGRTDAGAENPILWPADEKNWLIGKDPDAGKDWGQGEKGAAEDEMVRWHHWLDGYEFEQSPVIMKDRGSWWAEVYEITKSWTQFSGWTTTIPWLILNIYPNMSCNKSF